MYVLNVSVTDGVYSGYARVKVNILGENNNSPVFTRTVYEVAVRENLPPGAPVTTVKAADIDRGEYGKITYSIESQVYDKIFMIDPETGKLFDVIDFVIKSICFSDFILFDFGKIIEIFLSIEFLCELYS